MPQEVKNPAYRNKRVERWREVAELLRHALTDAVSQLRAAGIEPAPRIKDALVLAFIRGTSHYGPSYLVKPRELHACDYDSTGFCRVCDLPRP